MAESLGCCRAGQEHSVKEVYISAFHQFFKVFRKQKNGFSCELSCDEANILSTVFNDNGIPFENDISMLRCHNFNRRGSIIDEAPCNSRAVVELCGQEYNVLNFNGYLIRENHAERICLSFRNKKFKSRVEIVSLQHVTPAKYRYRTELRREAGTEKGDTPVLTPRSKPYKQITLSEYMRST
ncbi:hypothetical protein DFR58_14717 [Anaerobacterium chartisolvens]|uniref:Uncharacterized protein n=1 Tax=Anaerobacterium chartisolvens TaxID=1297424 RepID=A0A369AIB2_9FIRM|nr:hypothetical protein [Anaerobacterium chartisolvens]RCX07897.1 hypothetical protein DFR58_14717 [Anaerobacterium chartisolvens]